MFVGCGLFSLTSQMVSSCLAADVQAAPTVPDAKAQREKDSLEVDSFRGNISSAKQLFLQVQQKWQQKEPQTYAGLSITLARRLNSIAAGSDSQALRLEARKIASDLLSQTVIQHDLRSKVFCLDILAGLPYDTQEGAYSQESRFEEAKQFLLCGQQLNQLRSDLSTRTPAPPVDLSKYNWGNQIMISGMKPEAIQDPVLRQAYKAALTVSNANRELAQRKTETNRLSSIFLRAFDTFAQTSHAESAEDKAKLKDVLAGFDATVGEPYNVLKAKAGAP